MNVVPFDSYAFYPLNTDEQCDDVDSGDDEVNNSTDRTPLNSNKE